MGKPETSNTGIRFTPDSTDTNWKVNGTGLPRIDEQFWNSSPRLSIAIEPAELKELVAEAEACHASQVQRKQLENKPNLS